MRPVLTFAVLLGFTSLLRAERPPQSRESATDVVVGTVEKIETKDKPILNGGVQTDYVATVKVKSVERGTTVRAGDKVKIHWFFVTKKPSGFVVGAFGHNYGVAEKDNIRAYLLPRGGVLTVIYNRDGIEKIKE